MSTNSTGTKSAESGEHPACRAYQQTLRLVTETVDDAIASSKARLDAELEAFIEDIDDRAARKAFPSSY